MMKALKAAEEYIKQRTTFRPEIGIILGTGLNKLAEKVENPLIISYKDIPNMPVSTAPTHEGRFVLGNLAGKNVIMMQGRIHYYEGYTMQQVTFPIRLMKLLGIHILIVTNAAGSLNENLLPGDVVLITDHINFTGNNPLIGANLPEFGERFPSMNEPYSHRLVRFCQEIAQQGKIEVKTGIYTGLAGPSLETRAECKMLAGFGSDLVGMSTVPEVIVAVHGGLEVLGLSVVTNLSNIFHSHPHHQWEIQDNADKAREKLEYLIINLLKKNIERK